MSDTNWQTATSVQGNGDPSHWVTMHSAWLQKMVKRRLVGLDCDEEVVQEVLMAASRGGVEDLSEPEQASWISRVAIRQCALAWRSWIRRSRREGEYADRFQRRVADECSDPIYGLIADEERTMVREQLERIEPMYREILVLKYVHGYSYREISLQLKLSNSTVEYRLALARRALRVRLLESGIEAEPNNGSQNSL